MHPDIIAETARLHLAELARDATETAPQPSTRRAPAPAGGDAGP